MDYLKMHFHFTAPPHMITAVYNLLNCRERLEACLDLTALKVQELPRPTNKRTNKTVIFLRAFGDGGGLGT